MSKMSLLEIATPDDWHLHLRDGDALRHTVPATTRCFARAIVMPNLATPVETVADAASYRQRILRHVPESDSFEPLMTLYLTDHTEPAEIEAAAQTPFVHGCKLYPAGATTNSASGIHDLTLLYPVFEMMEKQDVPLLVHGEVPESEIDIFDRERIFVERHLSAIRDRFPELRIVLEHITTTDAVEFVLTSPSTIAATITPQHLLYNRNDMLAGGIRPHLYCLPILKARAHQEALCRAATSGNSKFFLGTDSAPHSVHAKEAACGCAGCYSAPVAIELYATIFDRLGALDRLEAFASCFGADFYRLPRNTGQILLERVENTVPDRLPYADKTEIAPLAAGQRLDWRLMNGFRAT